MAAIIVQFLPLDSECFKQWMATGVFMVKGIVVLPKAL